MLRGILFAALGIALALLIAWWLVAFQPWYNRSLTWRIIAISSNRTVASSACNWCSYNPEFAQLLQERYVGHRSLSCGSSKQTVLSVTAAAANTKNRPLLAVCALLDPSFRLRLAGYGRWSSTWTRMIGLKGCLVPNSWTGHEHH